jgi:hypothetical protein
MNITTKDVSTNTDPLNIQIYIDEDGRIKWRYGTSIIKSDYKSSELLEIAKDEDHREHIINTYFEKAFLINCGDMVDFAHIVPEDSHLSLELEINDTHDHFDYMQFMERYSCLSRDFAWKEFNLNSEKYQHFTGIPYQKSSIGRIYNSLNTALGNSMKICFIIFDDNVPKMNVISRAYETLLEDDNVFVAIGEHNPNDINNVSNIYAVVISDSIYEDVMDEFRTSNLTWQMSIIDYIQQHYFTSKMIQCDCDGNIY